VALGTLLGSDLLKGLGKEAAFFHEGILYIEAPKLPVAECVHNPISPKTADVSSLTDRSNQDARFILLAS
jgi:hypothetical protein